MHELIVSPQIALSLALQSAGLRGEDIFHLKNEYSEELYHICFDTNWLHYEFYVDAVSGEILGLNTEPMSETELVDSQSTGVFWKLKYNIIAAES